MCAQLIADDSTSACKRHVAVALWNLAYNDENQVAMTQVGKVRRLETLIVLLVVC